ncbi:MAG: Fic family protein [Myxococcota bacterium]|nr:Fic family protein [Myxococcota bacterium]
MLGESQAALAKIDGAMSTIKSSIVDATGAGLRGGLEEASKSVTDIVDRVAAMANGTLGTLSPSANKNPLAEMMAEEQGEEYKQREEAAADEVEDGRSKLSLEHKLDTMKTIAEKATGLDLGEKRGGDDDEGSFQFQSQLAGVLPHEAMHAVMSGASVNLREIAGNAASRAISAGDKGNGILSTAGEAVGDLVRGEDAKTIATNAMGNFGGEKIAGMIGGKPGEMIGGAAGGVLGSVLGGEKPNLGEAVSNAVNAINPFGTGANPFGGIVDMAMGAGGDAAKIFDPTNVANIAKNAATMSPQNLLDPSNVVANITEKIGSFDANAMISNIGSALDPANFAKMAGGVAGGLPGLTGNLVGIAGQAIDNVTARLKETAEALNPFSLDGAGAAGRATPENPAGDANAMLAKGAQGAAEGVAAGAASSNAIPSSTGPQAKPEAKADQKIEAKATDGKTADPKATDAKGDAKNVDAKAGEKAGEKGADAGAAKKKGEDDIKQATAPKGEAAAKSQDPAGAKGAAAATAHAGTATPQGEAAAKATGAAAATANAATGQAAPARGPQPNAQQAPQSNRPVAERTQATQPTRAANTANRNAAPVSGTSGGQTQITPQPVMSPAARDVAANEKQVTQPNVNIEARGESGALPGMPADLASQTPTPAGAQAGAAPAPAAPAPSTAPTSNRTVAALPTVAAQPTTAAKANPATAVTLPQAKGAPMAAGGAVSATGATPQPQSSSGASQAGAQSVPAAAKPAPPPPATRIPEQKATPGTAAPQTPSTQAPEPNIPPVRNPGGEGVPSPSGMVPATANLSADRSNAQSQLTAEAQTQSRVGPEANTMKQSQVASQKPAFEQTKRSGDAPRQQAVTASTTQGQQASQAGQQRGQSTAQSGNQQIQGQGQQATGERGQLQGVATANSAAVLQQTSPTVMQGATAPAQAAVQAVAAAGRAQQAIVNPAAVARAGQAGATNSQLAPFNAGQFNQIDQTLAQPMPETDMAAADQSKQGAEQTYQQANTQIDQLTNIQPPAISAPQSAGAGTVTKDGHPTRESAIANVEQQVTAQAQAQGPAKMQEAAAPLQQEVKQHTTSAQQAATTSADSQLQQHQAKSQQIKQTPPPTTGAQAAAQAQPQYQAHQAEATAASATMKGEIAGAQTAANAATTQAKSARDQQITQAQANYQQQSTAAQGQYTQAQTSAKSQFDSTNQTAQQSMATEQQTAQQAAQQQTTQAQQKADSDIQQQNAQLNSQQQAANASHSQQMDAANQQHDAQVQAAQAQMDGDVSSQQSQMQSQVSAEQSRGQTEVNQHLQEGEQGYTREVQAGEQEAAREQQRAQAEAAEKERQAQAEKDKNSGGVFGAVVGWVKDRFNDMMNAVKAVLAAARDMIVGIMERARQAAIAVLQRARQAALAALAKVKSAIQGVISACASAIRSIISACASLVRNLIQNLANMLKSLVQALTTLLQTLVQAFQAAVNALLDGLIAAVSLINKDLGDKLRGATQKYRDAFNNAMNTLSSGIKAAGDALQAKIQQAADGAIAVVNAAEQNLNAAVTRVEQTLNAAVETAYQAGAAAINRAFDLAETVVNKAFEVAKSAVEAYFNAQIAALDIVQQGVNAVADFVIAVADKVLEAVAKIAEAIINMIPESWTKWFVDFWNGPWRTAIIIGLATVAAVAITVATCGAAGPVAMILIAGLIGGTMAGTAYGAGELLAREGAIDLTENHPGEGVYVPGVGNVQIQIGPDGKPIPPANLTPEQQQAWEKNSQWALSNFNTQRDAEGNVTGYDRKSGSEIANYAVKEGIKGFGEGFVSSAGAMGGSLAGGAVAGLGVLGRVASNPVARQMIATAVEGGVGVVSQSVGAGWTAGFDAMAEGKSPGEAFGAAWKAGSESITDPGNWVAALATVGVVPLKTQAIAPLMNRVTGRVANQAIKTGVNEGVDVVVDTAAETVGSAGGAFVSTYYKAINEGKTPAEAMAAARTAANDAFKPEAIAQSLLLNVAGNKANQGAEAYAARRAGQTTPTGTPTATPDPTPTPDRTPAPRQSADPTPASDGRPLADRPTTARTEDGQATPDNNPRTTRGGEESNPTPRTTESDSTEVQRQRPAAGQDLTPPVKHSSEPTARDVAPIRERREAAPIREGDSTNSDVQPLRGQDGQPIKVDDTDTSATAQKPKDTNEPQRFQDRQTDQARVDKQMTEKGHSGIEVHSHFMGNVDPANFASTIGRSGEAPMLPRNPDGETAAQRVGDHSPYEPVMREIAKLNDFRHTTAEGPNGEQIITTRGRSGDALMQIDAAQQRIETLKSKLETEGDTMSPVERQRIEQEIHDEARSAVEKSLRASDETDFNSSYEVRDELVKKFYGAAERNEILTSRGVDPKNARMTDPRVVEAYTEHFTGRREIQDRIPQAVEAQRRLDAGEYADPKERKALQKQADSIREQMAYDAYAKDTLLELAKDGITYTEQSNSINKIGARFDEGQIDWLKSQLIKEHPEHAQAIQNLTVKHVTMINTNQFGVRGDQHRGDGSQVKTSDLHDAAGTVRPSDGEFTDAVKQLVAQTKRGDVIGVDIAGAEHFTFDGEGQRRMTELYDALLTEAGTPGGSKPLVLRPHVGEGANDVVPGQVGHRDANRQIVDGDNGPELSHAARAKENLENMIQVFESIAARPENNGKLPPDVIVRFGHATHTTPEMAARMAKLGIIAEVNLTSNIETGSVSQKPPANLDGKQDNTHTPETQPTRYELDPAKRGGTLDDHALATLIAADAPVILSTDAHSVMSTNMANEYNRAKSVIQEVRDGRRRVPIDESVIDPSKPPGTSRLMSYDEMPPHLQERFDRAERKLYEDANRYYDMRPKQDDAPATPDRVGKPISTELASKVDALKEGESVTIGRRGGKDGLVEHLRNKDVEFGIFRDAEGNYYVMRGGEDYLAPRSPNDRLIAHNHPGGTKRLSADDLDYMHSSTNGKQRSTLLLTPGDEGGVSRERVSDYTRTRPAENDPTKGPIREVPDAPEPTVSPDVTPAARTKPPTESSLETVLGKSGKKLEDYKNADSWELQSLASDLLAAKGIKQPTESQTTETLFQLDKAIKKGDTTFEAPFEAGALKKEDGVNDRLGNIFGEKRVFSADELTPGRLMMNDSERRTLEGGFESGAAGQVRAASFINARHRSEGDFSHAYGGDAWKNQLRAETYLNDIPKGSFVDGLSIEVMQEVNRLIHTPDTGMKAQALRGLAYVGRGFKWDEGGQVRDGKQYARPEQYSTDELDNLHEAGVRTKEFPLGMGHQLQYPDPADIRPRMNKLISDLKAELAKPDADPIAAAAQFQRHFVALHPFGDSNGRTSRALMNRILLEFDMPPAIFADQNRDMSMSPAEWRDEVAKGVARSKDYLGKSGRNSKDEYVGKVMGTPLATTSANKPITVDGLPFDLGADGFLYDPTGRPYMAQNGELIPMAQLEHYMMSRRIAAAGKDQAPNLLASTNESTRQFYDQISADPDAGKGIKVRDDGRARSADQAYKLSPDPEVAAMLAKLSDTSALDPTKAFQFDVGSSWGTPGNGNGTRNSAVMSKYTQMDLELWYIEKGLRDSKQPELVEQVRANRARLFEMARAEMLKASDATRISDENPHGFRFKYEQMMHDTSPLRFASFDEAINELGDKRMTVWRGDYSFSKMIGMAPNNDVRQPDAKQVADQRTKKSQITDIYDDLVKLEGSAVGRQYICTTSDLALLVGAFANNKKSQTVSLSSLPAPIRDRLLGWMDPNFPDGTSAEDKAKARQAALDRKESVVPTEDGGKEIRDFAGIPGTILKMRVVDKASGQVEIMAERKAFQIDLDKEAFLPGIYSLGGPSFEGEQELHGLQTVRPWKIKSTHEASTLKEEFPVTQAAPSAPTPTTPSDGGGVGFASGEGALAHSEGKGDAAPGTQPVPADGVVPPAPAAAATVEMETEWDAADGSGTTRTNVGVGERVFLTADVAGAWAATTGTSTGTGLQFTWTAPGTAGAATITFTPGGGGAAVTKTLNVVAPTSVVMTKVSDDSFASGTVGAGFVANVAFHPLNVSFAATQWKEDTGQRGTAATGDFTGSNAPPLPVHAANPNWSGIGAGNSGPTDHAAFAFTGATFTNGGSFKWAIAQRWKLRSAAAAGGLIETLDQTCVVTGAPHAGRTTVSKGGASATRNPDGTDPTAAPPAAEGAGHGRGYADDGPPTSLSAAGEGLSTGGARNETESPEQLVVGGRGFGDDGDSTFAVGEGQVVGIGKAGAPAPIKTQTTPDFINAHRTKVLAAIRDHIVDEGALELPTPHPRLTWATRENARFQLSKAIWEFADGNPKETLKLLSHLAHPANLFDLASDARRGPAGSQLSVVLVRLAAAFDAPLRQSILRMGTRTLVRLDEKGGVRSDVRDVIASSPLDALVGRVLLIPGVTFHTFKKKGAPDDTGGQPFKNGADGVLAYEWLGKRDRNLWNWIKVTKPTNVTAEQVAMMPLVGDGNMDAQQAYRIAAHPPYFGIPFETARLVREAWDYAPVEVERQLTGVDQHGPRIADSSVLGKSGVSDEAALATAPKASKTDLSIERAIDRTQTQLKFMASQLAPWKLAGELTGASKFVDRRKTEVTSGSKTAQQYASAMTAQERILNAAASELADLMGSVASKDIGPDKAHAIRPVVDVFRAYARAAGVSHVHDDAQNALAEARHKSKLLPLSLADDKIRSARAALGDERKVDGSETRSEDNIDALVKLEGTSAAMRAEAAKGRDLKAEDIEELAIDASELELRARLVTLTKQVKILKGRASEVGLDKGNHPGGGRSVDQFCNDILQHIDSERNGSWHKRLDLVNKTAHGTAKDPKNDEQWTAKQTRNNARNFEIKTVENMLANYAKDNDLYKKSKDDEYDFFTWAYGQVKDKELSNLIASIAIQVGVALLTGQIAGVVGATFRGLTAASEIATALRGTSLLYRGASIAAQATLQTGTQAAMGGKIDGGTFVENALGLVLTSAAMRPFQRLLDGSAVVERQIISGWKQFAKASGKFVAELAIDAGAGITAAALARQVVRGGKLDMAHSDEWITQGLSFAANRFAHGRAVKMQTRLNQAAHAYADRAKLVKLQNEVETFRRDTAKNEKSGKATPEEALAQLAKRHQLLLDEMNLLPADSAARKTLASEHANESAQYAEVPLQLSGLSPIVHGHVYEGTPATIAKAKEAAKQAGIELKPLGDNRYKIGENRVITIQPTGATAKAAAGASKSAHTIGPDVVPRGDGVFEAKPSKLEQLREHWVAKGSKVSDLRYDAATNTMHFELHQPGMGAVRVQSSLGPRINSFSALNGLQNKVMSGPMSPSAGHEIIQRLNRGDTSDLTALGIIGTGKLPRDVEFGLGLLPDKKTVVLVKGKRGEVDWGVLPGLHPLAHTHAAADLPYKQTSVPLKDLTSKSDGPSLAREIVFPSGADFIVMAQQGIEGHVVYTEFVVRNGKVMRAPDGDTGPRLTFTIVKSAEVGLNGQGQRLYKSTVEIKPGGSEKPFTKDVWVLQHAQGDSGHLFMTQPKGTMLREPTKGQRGGKRTPTSANDADAWVKEVRSKLTTQAEQDAFDKMIGKRSLDDVKKSFADADAAVNAVKKSAQRAGKDATFETDQAVRIGELETFVKVHKLDSDKRVTDLIAKLETDLTAKPASAKTILTSARSDLRTIVMGDFVHAELTKKFPGHDIKRDVQVWEGQDPKYKSVKEYKDAHSKMFQSSDRGVKMIGGRVFLEITDLDFVVMTKNTKHVVHTTELKTGSGDTHLKAATQLEDAKQAFTRHAADPVKHPLNLLEGGKKDVTGDIDPKSMVSATRATHGPAGKSFEPDAPSAKTTPRELADVKSDNFKVKADELDKLIGKMLDSLRKKTS